MNREQEQQIVGYYSTTDQYIHNKLYSDEYQDVFTKDNDKYKWLVLEQKNQNEVEVRQTDRQGKIVARNNYEFTRNFPKCISVERLREDGNGQVHFNSDEINLIFQFGELGKAETCANLSAVLPQIEDSETRQTVVTTLEKLNALSSESCVKLIATTKRQKLTERDHSIKARLAKAKEQSKQQTIIGRKRHKTHSKGKGDMEL